MTLRGSTADAGLSLQPKAALATAFKRILWLLSAAMCLIQIARTQELMLRPSQSLNSSRAVLDVGDYAIPCAADWNGDGQTDLLVGYQPASKVALFLNTGSDSNPVLGPPVNLRAGGADIYLPALSCGAPAPFVCDYDNDGKRDLLVGSGADGFVYFYRNTNSDSKPILDRGVRLLVGSSPLTVSYRATPYVCDWDGDGLNDLLCGNGDGWVFFFKNIGTAQAPAYSPGIRLQAGGTNLNLGYRALVRVFDWDGDGVNDLVGSSTTGVYWCKNIGSDSSPQLLAPKAVRAPLSGSGLQPISVGDRMRIDLVDWNKDGVIDLLVGRYDGTIYYYEGYKFALTQMTAQPAGQYSFGWNSARYLKYNVFFGASPATITNLAVSNLPGLGNLTAWTNHSTDPHRFYKVQLAP